MAEKVKVSLIHAQGYRASKSEPFTQYPSGVVEMPREHAEAMGLLHRIVGKVEETDEGVQRVTRLPFNGAFDEKLATILTNAGYNTMEDVGRATQDELRALDGIGPANFERIQSALRGA